MTKAIQANWVRTAALHGLSGQCGGGGAARGKTRAAGAELDERVAAPARQNVWGRPAGFKPMAESVRM